MIAFLKPGSRIGISGASGVGKTRFFRWLVGLERREEPGAWDASSFGLERPNHPEAWRSFRREVQLVPQRVATPPLSVEEFLREPFGLGFRLTQGPELPSRESLRAELEALGFADPSQILARSMAQLSGGELSRVALVRSLLLKPRVLLLDEPTAALDAALERKVEDRLRRWWDESPSDRGWVLCSHKEEQLRRFCLERYRLEGFEFVSG